MGRCGQEGCEIGPLRRGFAAFLVAIVHEMQEGGNVASGDIVVDAQIPCRLEIRAGVELRVGAIVVKMPGGAGMGIRAHAFLIPDGIEQGMARDFFNDCRLFAWQRAWLAIFSGAE